MLIVRSEIDEVIEYIQAHLYDPLPLNRLAGHISYSPSHFARIFKERTGLPPLYYVSSLRLQRAKDLLLRTTLPIRDVGLEIGQQSLGTFTTRFTERVGVTPSEFRQSALQGDTPLQSLRRLRHWHEPELRNDHGLSQVHGAVHAEVPFQGIVLIGLFPKPIPEGMPLYGTVLPGAGSFRFTGVKPGTYYLMATSVAWGMQAMDFLLPHHTLRSRSKEPVRVEPGKPAPHRILTLHPPRTDDPPILISIPLLMNTFLKRVAQDGDR
ncbi:helix-turn-helix transcriptional regulator [Gorillibacterium sp. sgz5001074]|uniref:helix-turn-helix transcriptional regulator n=1 Tax=Gorillibacterium sp. sgz5001074 TaxID=3446695 RepID=UPI003F660D5B